MDSVSSLVTFIGNLITSIDVTRSMLVMPSKKRLELDVLRGKLDTYQLQLSQQVISISTEELKKNTTQLILIHNEIKQDIENIENLVKNINNINLIIKIIEKLMGVVSSSSTFSPLI